MIPVNTAPKSTYIGNDTAFEFDFYFRASKPSDVIVKVVIGSAAPATLFMDVDYTLVYNSFPLLGGTVSLIGSGQSWMQGSTLKEDVVLIIAYNLAPSQVSNVKVGGPLGFIEVEKSLDRAVSDIIAIESLFPDLAGNADKIIIVNSTEDGLDLGPSVQDIQDDLDAAAAFAAAAAASAANAQARAEEAQVSADDSQDSADLAERTVDLLFYTNIVNLTFADSPYTISLGQTGYLFKVNASGGAVTINLPAVPPSTPDFRVSVVKTDSTSNAVNFYPNGSDTIENLATLILAAQFYGFTFTPDPLINWRARSFIAGGSSGLPTIVSEVPTGTIDGVNAAFTLTQSTTDESLMLFQNGIRLNDTEYSVDETSITLVTAPALGQSLFAWYIATEISATGMQGRQEVPAGTIDGVNATFTISQNPYNKSSLLVFKNGVVTNANTWTLTESTTGGTITFIAGEEPTLGSDLSTFYLLNVLQANNGISAHTHPLSEIRQSGATSGQVPQWSGSAWVPVNSASIGVTDHGALTGLSDDDHTQYHNDTRGDVRYYTKAQVDTNIGVVQTDIDAHESNTSNPHGVTKAQVGLSNVDNTSDLNKPISTATQTALDNKVTKNTAITGATKTKITYDSKGLVTVGADATTADIADSSNKRYVTDANLVVIGNTSGTNTGDQNLSGYELLSNKATNLTSPDNTKYPTTLAVQNAIDAIPAGGVTSFNTRTGAVTSQSGDYTKSDVGLSNADNTSDINKPVSTATQTALDLKVDENAAITGATKTKVTYDAKGLVTAGADATTADINPSTDRNYVTDAQQTIINNTSNTNTGDIALGGFGSSSNSNGMTLSGQTLNLEPADASNGGAVSATTQSFGGIKTFTAPVNLYGDAYLTSETADGVLYNGALGKISTQTGFLYDSVAKILSVATPPTPNAAGHFGVYTQSILDQVNLTAEYRFGSPGYTYGTLSSTNYSVRGSINVNGTDIFSTNAVSTTGNEGTDLDAGSFTATPNYGSGGYVASGIFQQYIIHAMYEGGSVNGPSPAPTSFTDNNSASNYNVDLTWTAPTSSPSSLSGYKIYNNTNGTFIETSDTFVTDDSTWASGTASPTTGFTQYILNTNTNASANTYFYYNDTLSKYISDASANYQDNATITNNGSPSTPNSVVRNSLRSEGSTHLCYGGSSYLLGFFGSTGAARQSGDLLTALEAYGLVVATSYSRTLISGLTDGYVCFGKTPGYIDQSNNLYWDNSNVRLGIGTTGPLAKIDIRIASATFIGQMIRGAASQSGDLIQFQNSAATVLAAISATGLFRSADGTAALPGNSFNGDTDTGIYRIGANNMGFSTNGLYRGDIGSGGGWTINGFTAAVVGLIVKAAASQTANLTNWLNSAGTVIASVDAGGTMYCGGGSATSYFAIDHTGSSGNSSLRFRKANVDQFQMQWDDSTSAINFYDLVNSKAVSWMSVHATDPKTTIGPSARTHARLTVEPADAATIAQVVRGATSQSASLQEWWNSSSAVQASVSPLGKIGTQAGISAVLAKVGGRINQSTTQATSASTTETDLHSYTIAANTFVTNGDTIRFRSAGTFAASAFTKQLKAKLGGTTIFDSGALGISLATNWVLEGEIIRSGSSTQKCSASLTTSSGTLSAYASYQATTITDTSSMTLKTTGQVGTTGGTDVQEEVFVIEFIPAF